MMNDGIPKKLSLQRNNGSSGTIKSVLDNGGDSSNDNSKQLPRIEQSSLSKILRRNNSKNGLGTKNYSPSSSSSLSLSCKFQKQGQFANTNKESGLIQDNGFPNSRNNEVSGRNTPTQERFENQEKTHHQQQQQQQQQQPLRKLLPSSLVILSNFDEFKSSLKGISDESKLALYGTQERICDNGVDECSFDTTTDAKKTGKNSQTKSLRRVDGFRLLIASEKDSAIGMSNHDLMLDKTATQDNTTQWFHSYGKNISNKDDKKESGEQDGHENTAQNDNFKIRSSNNNISTLISQKELKEYIFGSPIRYLAPKSMGQKKTRLSAEFKSHGNMQDNPAQDMLLFDHNTKFRIIQIPLYEPLVLISTLSCLPTPSKTSISVSMLMSSRYLSSLLEGWNNGLYFWFKNVQHKLSLKLAISVPSTNTQFNTDLKPQRFGMETEKIFTSFVQNFIPNLLSYYEIPRLFTPPLDYEKTFAYNWFKQVFNWLELKDDGNKRLLYLLTKIIVDYKKVQQNNHEDEIQRIVLLSGNSSIANKLILIISAILPNRIHDMQVLLNHGKNKWLANDSEHTHNGHANYTQDPEDQEEKQIFIRDTNSSKNNSSETLNTKYSNGFKDFLLEESVPSSPLVSPDQSSSSSYRNSTLQGLAIPNSGKNKKTTFGLSRQNSGIFHSSSFSDGTSVQYLSSSLSSSFDTKGSWFGSFGNQRANSPSTSDSSQLSAANRSGKEAKNGTLSSSTSSAFARPSLYKSGGSSRSLLHMSINNTAAAAAAHETFDHLNDCDKRGKNSTVTTPEVTEHTEYPWPSPSPKNLTQGNEMVSSLKHRSPGFINSTIKINHMHRSASRYDDKIQLDESVSKAFDNMVLNNESKIYNIMGNDMEIKPKNDKHSEYLQINFDAKTLDCLNTHYYHRQVPSRLTSYQASFNPNFNLQAIPYSKYSEAQLMKALKMDLKILQDKHQNSEENKKKQSPVVESKCLLVTLPTHEVKEFILLKNLAADSLGLVQQRCIKFIHSSGKVNLKSNPHLTDELKAMQAIFEKAFVLFQDVESHMATQSTDSNTLEKKHNELLSYFKEIVHYNK